MTTYSRWQATITDEEGDIVAGASVTVTRESDGAAVALKSNRAGSGSLSNPATADSDGFVYFYAPAGRYKIVATSGGFSRTWRDVPLGTAQEYDVDTLSGTDIPNLCLNPGMQVWQNDRTLSAIAHRTPLADGFLWGTANGTAAFEGSRSSDVPDSTVPYSIKIACTTADASPTTSVDRHIRYAIYGHALKPWASSNLVIKFSVKSNKTGTYCVVAINEARDKCYIVEYTINSADTWEEKTVTIPMGSKSGTWNLEDGFGVGIRFTLVATSPITASANSWQSGNYLGTSNQVNLGDSTSNTFYLSKVQICPETCPDFVLPSYETALTNAQRQYRVIDTDTGGVNIGPGLAVSVDSVNFDILLPFPMYAPPTISYKGVLDTDIYFQAVIGATLITGATFTSFARSKNMAKWSMNKTGAYTAGDAHNFRLQTTSGKLVIDGHLA